MKFTNKILRFLFGIELCTIYDNYTGNIVGYGIRKHLK